MACFRRDRHHWFRCQIILYGSGGKPSTGPEEFSPRRTGGQGCKTAKSFPSGIFRAFPETRTGTRRSAGNFFPPPKTNWKSWSGQSSESSPGFRPAWISGWAAPFSIEIARSVWLTVILSPSFSSTMGYWCFAPSSGDSPDFLPPHFLPLTLVALRLPRSRSRSSCRLDRAVGLLDITYDECHFAKADQFRSRRRKDREAGSPDCRVELAGEPSHKRKERRE